MQDLQCPAQPSPLSPCTTRYTDAPCILLYVVLPFCTFLTRNFARTSFMKYSYIQQKKDIGSFLAAEF